MDEPITDPVEIENTKIRAAHERWLKDRDAEIAKNIAKNKEFTDELVRRDEYREQKRIEAEAIHKKNLDQIQKATTNIAMAKAKSEAERNK